MDTVKLSQARVYVGTYGKYNNGSLCGAWLNLSDYSDKEEFIEACRLLHPDEEDPEFMFQDWDGIPEGLISPGHISEILFDLRDAIEVLDDIEQEAFFAYCDDNPGNLASADADDLISNFQNAYCGQYDSEEDFACKIIQGREDLSEFALMYFDYGAYAP